MLIDTHCHIHDRGTYNFAFSRQQIGKKFLREHPDFPHEPTDFTPEKIIARAHANDVKKMICIGTSHEDSMSARDFASKYASDGVFWAYGIHPDEATGTLASESVMESGLEGVTRAGFVAAEPSVSPRQRIAGYDRDTASAAPVTTGRRDLRLPKGTLAQAANRCTLAAIGEVGLDYRDTTANRIAQIKLFEQMLQLAKDHNLPLIFHIRDAFDDFFSVISNFPDVRGAVHSFSDNDSNLKKSLDKGFYIGVNGLATFAPEIPLPPLERMLLETDAPFLTPIPFRGTINEPARVQNVCAYISKIKGESEANIAQITTENAEKLFNI